MKPIMMIGIVLIALGAVALAYQGITYTSHEKITDIGPIQAAHQTQKTIPLSPVLGGAGGSGEIALVILAIAAKNIASDREERRKGTESTERGLNK